MTEREEALLFLVKFFNSRLACLDATKIAKAKELISKHEIYTSEVVDFWVKFNREYI